MDLVVHRSEALGISFRFSEALKATNMNSDDDDGQLRYEECRTSLMQNIILQK